MKARTKPQAKTTAKNQRPSRGSWKRLEVNIQLRQYELDEIKRLARVSKLGWSTFVAHSLCGYAVEVKDRMEGREAAEALARKEGAAPLIREQEQTKPSAESKPGLENTGAEARLALVGIELKALEQWRDAEYEKDCPIAAIAHFAMLFALSNPKRFSGWADGVVAYCEAEDMDQFVYMRSRLAALYSTKKLKIA